MIPVEKTVKALRAAYVEAGNAGAEQLAGYARALQLIVEVLSKEVKAHGTVGELPRALQGFAYVERSRALLATGQAHRAVLVLLFSPADAIAGWRSRSALTDPVPLWLRSEAGRYQSSMVARLIRTANEVDKSNDGQLTGGDESFLQRIVGENAAYVISWVVSPGIMGAIGTAKDTQAAAQDFTAWSEKAAEAATGAGASVAEGVKSLMSGLVRVAAVGALIYGAWAWSDS